MLTIDRPQIAKQAIDVLRENDRGTYTMPTKGHAKIAEIFAAAPRRPMSRNPESSS